MRISASCPFFSFCARRISTNIQWARHKPRIFPKLPKIYFDTSAVRRGVSSLTTASISLHVSSTSDIVVSGCVSKRVRKRITSRYGDFESRWPPPKPSLLR